MSSSASSSAAAADRLVTVATFPEPAEANLARTALEAAGIDAVLRGANANSMIPVAFESQLQVRAEDEVAARRVLTGADDDPATAAEVDAAEREDEIDALPGQSTED